MKMSKGVENRPDCEGRIPTADPTFREVFLGYSMQFHQFSWLPRSDWVLSSDTHLLKQEPGGR